MNVCLLTGAVASHESASTRVDLPAFRKATQPMLLVFDAIEAALAKLPLAARDTLPEWGIVVGVDHGELEVTKDFLCTLKNRGMARPFLFQNSLHNATLGFLSMQLGLMGPGATTSTGFFGGEDALDLACDYVRSGAASVCFAIGVEALDDEMLPAAQYLLGSNARCGNGAAVAIVASEEFVAQHGLKPLARSIDVRCHRKAGAGKAQVGSDAFYGANAIERVILALAARVGSLELQKPDGAFSRIEMEIVS